MSKKIIVYMLCIAQISAANILYGDCPSDGINLWRLTAQIGSSVGIQNEVQQSSLPAFFITTPGHYKLCENVSNGLINIGASDVILDLGGYYMDNVFVTIASGNKNVTVKNGVIKNTAQCFDIGPNTQNILLEDIVIDTIVPFIPNPAFTWAVRVSSGPVTGLTIRNVSIYNGCTTNIILSGFGLNSLTDVVLENITCVGTNSAFVIAPPNPSAVIRLQVCDSLVVKNISLINQFQELYGLLIDSSTDVQVDGLTINTVLPASTGTPSAFLLLNSENVFINNAIVDGGQNTVYENGFLIEINNSFVTMENCSASFSFGSGFVCRTRQNGSVYKKCTSYNNGADGFFEEGYNQQYYDCVAYNNGRFGFQVQIENNNLLMERCVADNNINNGFNINIPVSFLTSKILFTQCIANRNGNHGFSVDNHGIFSYCEATNNVQNGFNILGNVLVPYHNVVLYQCIASTNLGRGINNAGDATFIIDTRSSSTIAPAYQLNQLADVFGTATVVTY